LVFISFIPLNIWTEIRSLYSKTRGVPKSVSAHIKMMDAPAKYPGRSRGNVILRNVCKNPAPRLYDASSDVFL